MPRPVASVVVALALVSAASVLSSGAAAQRLPAREAPTKTEIARGVFLFATRPYGDVGLDGNSVALIGRDGVLVFDTNGTPAASAAVLAEIKKLTPAPVRYVVNSHWHWDHWYGTETYTQAFPDVRVVAHEKTRQLMMGPALEFNRPGLEQQLPRYIESLEKRVAAAEAANPAPSDLSKLKATLEEDRFFLGQKTGVRHVFPNLTFDDRLTIYLGDIDVQVLHYERAVTPGDAFLYLPKEKIVVTGDLLVNPISYALSCYPSEWLRTLERIDALDASVIVPGHGEPLRDKALLRATMDLFRELIRQGKEARAKGLDADQARDAMMPGLRGLMVKITRDDPALNEAFRVQLVDWYLHRVYDELSGSLTDAIAPIPRS
jgi:cyclase